MTMQQLVHPLPRLTLGGVPRLPVFSQEFRSPSHLGLDVMYRWREGDPTSGDRVAINHARPPRPVFCVPVGTRALAIAAGKVIFAYQHRNGWRTRIRTDSGLDFLDLHMIALLVSTGERVSQGQPIGIVGGDPTDKPLCLVHLHHEHRRPALHGETPDGYGTVPYDPEPELRHAVVIEDHG